MIDPDELPDNMSRWPRDSWTLFGLKYGDAVDSRELRQVYSRLIRRFRPESHPAEFARIHGDYQRLRDHSSRRNRDRSTIEPSFDSEWTGNGSAHTRPHSSDTNNEQVGRRATVPDEGDVFSDETLSPAEAYRRLQEIHQQHPTETTAAALYWHLVLHRDLERHTQPIDWLIRGLQRFTHSGLLVELLDQELVIRPHGSLRPEFSQLITRLPKFSNRRLLSTRWKRAVFRRQFELIRDDLTQLRDVVSERNSSEWIRIQIMAANLLAFCSEPSAIALMKSCQREVESFGELALQMSDELYELDLLERVAQQYHESLELVPYPARELLLRLPKLWFDKDTGSELRSLISQLLQHRERALTTVDVLVKAAPDIVQFYLMRLETVANRTIRGFRYQDPDQLVSERIIQFQTLSNCVNYLNLRVALLDFCCNEFIPVERYADVLSNQREDWLRFDGTVYRVDDSILADTSLQFLSYANLAIHA